MKKQLWQDWTMTAIGIWLFLSPWALAIARADLFPVGVVLWNMLASGVVVALLGVLALIGKAVWEEWVEMLTGVWLLVSPWILGFGDQPAMAWNASLCGLTVIALSVWSISRRQSESHA
ncbi:MAG TPA: SPW repeat protein [Asticcacaulis sp.]|nr:SPW repeat protein [Asticcacaulis sp.]